MLGVPEGGLLVDGVEAGGLAAAAGLRAGDIILSLGGQRLAQPGDLAFAIEAALDGEKATVSVRREGAVTDLTLAFAAAEGDDGPGIGVKVREIDLTAAPKKVSSYRLAALGVVLGPEAQVTEVTENSPALFAGMAAGDRILAVNGAAMDAAALEALEITEAVMVLVAAPDGSTRHVFLDPWGGAEGVRPVGGANVLDPDVVVF